MVLAGRSSHKGDHMVDNISFAIMSLDVLNADIGDLAFRVYAEIYVCNYNGVTTITDKLLSDTMHRSIVTINRAVHELASAGLIDLYYKDGRRNLITHKNAKKCQAESIASNIEDHKLPKPLQAFFDLYWNDHK